MRTKGAKDKHIRKQSANSSPERMRALADARRLPESRCTIQVLKSAKDALFAKVKRQDRTMFATRALQDALDHI